MKRWRRRKPRLTPQEVRQLIEVDRRLTEMERTTKRLRRTMMTNPRVG